ncbi:LysR substrate-binding domain-containing protein [Pseudomonas kurunegalensis]|uniref:LysR substrate-binding domain-containing protein n=1 Tax=Pseudomonas kurunegalensis TaxID=485880 RepID=UPI00236497CD|nr:LysR substrate-binding domain-containing protein [Pseudomonas kurunegalensis]MDD2137773.1 LysR substrate-binding domain-containing protein [Pseudomonas kurunegalensis]
MAAGESGELLGVEVLPDLLRPFHYEHPGLKLELSISDALEDIARLQSDIAVRLMRPNEADITVRRVGSLQIGIRYLASTVARGRFQSVLPIKIRSSLRG